MGINEYVKIGNRIRELRIEKGYTQKEMAELAGISYTTYSNYENNNREPSMKQIEKIAMALEMTTDDLLGYTHKFPISSGIVDNENYHIMRLLKAKDELSIKQMNLDKNYDPKTEESRSNYATDADYIQFHLKKTVSDINDFRLLIEEKMNGQELSLPYEILFSLKKINPEGEKRILEEIENLSYNPKYKLPIKPDSWDPFSDI